MLLSLVLACRPEGGIEPGAPLSLEAVARVDRALDADFARAAHRPAIPGPAGGFVFAEPAARPERAFASLGAYIDVALPARGDGPLQVHVPGGERVSARRRGLGPSEGAVDRGVVVYDGGRDVSSLVYARGASLEELFVVKAPADLGYDLELPRGWALRESDAHTVELVDENARAALRISALHAWDEAGAPVDLAMTVDAGGVRIRVLGDPDYPIVVDPLIGSSFTVYAATSQDQHHPAIAYNSVDNEYLVVWESRVASTGRRSVSARRVGPTGRARGRCGPRWGIRGGSRGGRGSGRRGTGCTSSGPGRMYRRLASLRRGTQSAPGGMK